MSWDKNTHVGSEIDSVLKILKDLNEEFTVTYLGEVPGYGLNDSYGGGKDMYPIRKLEYRDKVIVEQMERTHDCDTDDILVSHTYTKGNEPQNLPLEIYTDCEEFGCKMNADGTCSADEDYNDDTDPYEDYDEEHDGPTGRVTTYNSDDPDNVDDDDEGPEYWND